LLLITYFNDIVAPCACTVLTLKWLLAGLLVVTLGTGDAALRVKEEVEQCLLKIANRAQSSNAKIAVSFRHSEPLSC
jgi:hypothetical protein